MGRQDQTPDLFSTVPGASPNQGPEVVTKGPSRGPALPKDLPKAIQYLADEELDWLLRTVVQEAKRRGRPVPMVEAGRPNRQRQAESAPKALTQGQLNAVRAAFKAGVTPARIARQFGLSASQVRKALS
jgi:hypothetical protein